MKKFLILSACLLIGLASYSQNTVSNINVKTHDGQTFDLYEQLKLGRAVVMDFWWVECGNCVYWAPDMEQLYQFYGQNQKHVYVVGLNITDENGQRAGTNDNAGIAKFKSDHGLSYPDAGYEGNGGTIRSYYWSDINPIIQSNGFTQAVLIIPDLNNTSNSPVVWHDFGAIHNPAGQAVADIKQAITDNNVEALHAQATVNTENHSAVEKSIFVFPNPASDVLNIHVENLEENVIVEIHDLSGKLVYNEDFSGQQDIRISTAELTSGLYNVSIVTNESRSSKKIQIQ